MRCTYDSVLPLILRTKPIEGAWVEIGVWWGQTLIPMAHLGQEHSRIVYGFDSFEGMAPATEKDVDEQGKARYLEGSHKSEFEWVRSALTSNARLFKGWVPEVLDNYPSDHPIAFCHVDVDQYEPTLEAMLWAWPRMAPGGVLVSHDWFPQRDGLAAGGVKEFMERTGAQMSRAQTNNNHAIFIKP